MVFFETICHPEVQYPKLKSRHVHNTLLLKAAHPLMYRWQCVENRVSNSIPCKTNTFAESDTNIELSVSTVVEMNHSLSCDKTTLDADAVRIPWETASLWVSTTQWILQSPPTPYDKNIRQILGFAGYYRRFIPNFAKVTKPLSKLLQNNETKKKNKPSKT